MDRSSPSTQIRADPRGASRRARHARRRDPRDDAEPGETEIELLARPLDSGDAPERSDGSPGRFLARTPHFLDPAVYARGRRITVLGTVTGSEERQVGELPYRYPVVAAERIKLWPKEGPWVGGEYPPVLLDSPVLPYPR